MPPTIYLDNNATTRPDPLVVEAMLPWLKEDYGNPSSVHEPGRRAKACLQRSRAQVARLLGARSPSEVVFTSGGTEALNTALSLALASGRGSRVVTSTVEHSALREPIRAHAAAGHPVVEVGVDAAGRLDVERALDAVGEGCALLALLLANNETGVLLAEDDVRRLGEACRAAGALFLLDAVQAAGKVPLALGELPVDLAVVSGHKIHGPKGVGALWIRKGALDGAAGALIRGGAQEAGRRGGTENVPGIAGLGVAAELAAAFVADDAALGRLAARRDRLEEGLLARIPGCRRNGDPDRRAPGTANLRFPRVAGEALALLLAEEGVCVSTGAACDEAHAAPSHVLLAMGAGPEEAGASLRFSLSRETTEAEVDAAVEITARSWEALAALSTEPAGLDAGSPRPGGAG